MALKTSSELKFRMKMRKKLQPCKTPSITPTPTRRPEPAFVAGCPAWMNDGPQAHLPGRTKHRGPLLGRLFDLSGILCHVPSSCCRHWFGLRQPGWKHRCRSLGQPVSGALGIGSITRFLMASGVRLPDCKRGAQFRPESYISAKEARSMDAFIHYGIAAAAQAIADAGLPTGDALGEEAATRIGCVIGSGIEACRSSRAPMPNT